ncbi:uncharacterized protein LOC143034759 [Oratosquilla oratoria]|uniref:uncharacterized protein LOC143034759 n=1 Tax=Oratosquilla oratoria TaxID=337810 RepID=UPI003F7769C5
MAIGVVIQMPIRLMERSTYDTIFIAMLVIGSQVMGVKLIVDLETRVSQITSSKLRNFETSKLPKIRSAKGRGRENDQNGTVKNRQTELVEVGTAGAKIRSSRRISVSPSRLRSVSNRLVPQASLQFSPFELVYGRSVRGPLQVLRELWEEEPDPAVKTTYAYVLDLAEQLRETYEVTRQELLKAKEVQQSYYDKKTKLRILEEGDQCLLLPTAHNKLLSQWQGPFEVVKRLSDLNCLVQVGPDQKRIHINMLKKYYTPQVTCSAVAQECLLNRGGDHVLSPEQCECLQLVECQFKQSQMVCAAVVVPEVEELADYAPLTPEAIQVFSDKPGVAKVDCHEIRLTSSVPIRLKPYPIPIRLADAVKKEIDNMEAAGIIEKSSSPYCSPIVVVRKKDGGVRICGDYRGVNAVTQVDAEPMSDQQEIFAKVANSKIFSKMDLEKGFFQIPLGERSKQVTAVATPNGLYQFKVLTFGLTNSPAVFNRAMRQVLHGIHRVEAFVNDILIHSFTFEEHLEILEKEEAFTTLKNLFCKEPVLQLPDFNQPFILRNDASQEGIGSILMQEKVGDNFPVSYHSRKLKPAELNYSMVEKELLAVEEGVKKYCYFLY